MKDIDFKGYGRYRTISSLGGSSTSKAPLDAFYLPKPKVSLIILKETQSPEVHTKSSDKINSRRF